MADEEARSEAIVERFRVMKTEAEALWAKITELDLERTEHELVLQTLKPLDAQRRCFRLVGGVLVERTVAEVAPAVTRNKEEIEAVRGAHTRGSCKREPRKRALNKLLAGHWTPGRDAGREEQGTAGLPGQVQDQSAAQRRACLRAEAVYRLLARER
jgi:chaperonin cofactor prefoldin